MLTAQEFIKTHKMEYTSIDIAEQMEAYLDEMKKGLCGEESSLLMIPTYISLKSEVKREKPVICVDAGGTNLRITVAKFLQDGSFHTEEINRYMMPGVEKEVEAGEFFDILAGLIAPLTGITKDIVISFAYPGKVIPSLPNIDCEIVEITKEVKVKNAGGKKMVDELKASFEKLGIHGGRIVVINDSVATCLAGKAEKINEGYGSFTGTILGTGSNSCYMENIQNIAKLHGFSDDGVMVINTEAGNYSEIPRSDIDLAFDESMLNPGRGIFEKMASGGYLGGLCDFTLRAAGREGVFSQEFTLAKTLTTVDVNEFLEDGTGALKGYFQTERDAWAAQEIILNIVLRAGRLLALQMAAMAVKACKDNSHICMTIEGTTYDKMFALKKEALTNLLPYLDSIGIAADVISVDLAVLKGCAIAGLST